MIRDFHPRSSTATRLGTVAMAVSCLFVICGCQGGEDRPGSTSPAPLSTELSSPMPVSAQGVIISSDGLYQLMPDFHCRDDGPDSEDNRCLTLECPATADSEAEGRPVIWKKALRTVVNPGWQDWVPVSGPTCFYDPKA